MWAHVCSCATRQLLPLAFRNLGKNSFSTYCVKEIGLAENGSKIMCEATYVIYGWRKCTNPNKDLSYWQLTTYLIMECSTNPSQQQQHQVVLVHARADTLLKLAKKKISLQTPERADMCYLLFTQEIIHNWSYSCSVELPVSELFYFDGLFPEWITKKLSPPTACPKKIPDSTATVLMCLPYILKLPMLSFVDER